MKKLLVALSGLILPGVGHMLVGRVWKGIMFLLLLGGMFLVGVGMDPDYYGKFGEGPFVKPPDVARLKNVNLADLTKDEGMIDRVWRTVFNYVFPFVVGIVTFFTGWICQSAAFKVLVALPFVESIDKVPVTVKDIGYCFALLSGLLNILVMLDAYDIAYNVEVLKARWNKDRLPFVLICLIALCVIVSLVYALTTSEDSDRIMKDTFWGFLLMFGGICLLGAILMAIPLVFLG